MAAAEVSRDAFHQLSKTERITWITGDIYPDRAAKQQAPVMQVILSITGDAGYSFTIP
jgi:hypothetical protein